jgi:hypothetical protein
MGNILKEAIMRIDIHTSKRVRLKNRECYGLTCIKKNNKIDIYISETACKDMAQFATTLFHEMLHAWIEIIKSGGATIDARKSHRFIYDMEKKLAVSIKLMQGRKK